jgi:shikimate kinase
VTSREADAPPRARLVFIYGPPGAGKLTVARELAALTGFTLFDNHMSIDWASSIFDRSRLLDFQAAFGASPYWRLIERLRMAVYEEVIRSGASLISTFVYAHDKDLPFVNRVHEAVESVGGDVLLVQLVCERDELARRVEAEQRGPAGKLASAGQLQELMGRMDLLTQIPDGETLRIDNTQLAPAEVARRIAEHYALL